MTPDDFRAAFTAAEGWGTLSQTRQAVVQTQRIEVRWGQLNLQSLAFEVPEGQPVRGVSLTCGPQTLEAEHRQDGRRLELRLKKPLTLREGETLTVVLSEES